MDKFDGKVNNQTLVTVTVEQYSPKGQWYVHIRKGPGSMLGVHPQLTAKEAEWLARDVANAAADCYRKNVALKL
jgi:hypothetical protein